MRGQVRRLINHHRRMRHLHAIDEYTARVVHPPTRRSLDQPFLRLERLAVVARLADSRRKRLVGTDPHHHARRQVVGDVQRRPRENVRDGTKPELGHAGISRIVRVNLVVKLVESDSRMHVKHVCMLPLGALSCDDSRNGGVEHIGDGGIFPVGGHVSNLWFRPARHKRCNHDFSRWAARMYAIQQPHETIRRLVAEHAFPKQRFIRAEKHQHAIDLAALVKHSVDSLECPGYGDAAYSFVIRVA